MKEKIIKIRRTKNKLAILTFGKTFENQLLTSCPWAARTVVAQILNDTGTVLDHEQEVRLNSLLDDSECDKSNDPDIYLALRWLSAGIRLLDCDLERVLKILDKVSRKLCSSQVAIAEEESNDKDTGEEDKNYGWI